MFEVETPNRTHVPDLERAAYNQMPKDNGFTDLKLWRFDGTDLYQWRGRPKMTSLNAAAGAPHYYAWDDQATEVFQIKSERETVTVGADEVGSLKDFAL